MNPLQQRLTALRRRLRFVATFRGLCVVLGVLLFAAILMGVLDWRVHLPGAIRAVVLAGTLGGAGFLAYHFLVRPLNEPADDLALALRIESHFPELNDALASAVQFLESNPTEADAVAPTLRREAVRRALAQVEDRDFQHVVDERGVRSAWLGLLAASCLLLAFLIWQPALAAAAFIRLADPFGGHEWPRQTQLTIKAESRTARGEAFLIHGVVRGVIPEKASATFHFADDSRAELSCDVLRTAQGKEGRLSLRLEPERVRQSFRFQVRAHDAVSDWHRVIVLPPPQLAPLNGRPSPQVTIRHPAYTDLPDLELPDGTTSIEVLAGSQVTLRAATDLPIARAWLEYPGELTPCLHLAQAIACLERTPFAAATRLLLSSQQIQRIPARVRDGGCVLDLEFFARVNGVFVLRLEDESGLTGSRLFEVRVVADPVPVVQLERPSKAQDTFDVLPEAEVTLQVHADDPQFGLRSVWLEYRVQRADSPVPAQPGRLVGFNHAAATELVSALFPLARGTMRQPPTRIQFSQRWALKGLNLKHGDLVRIQAFAADFDDITVGKLAGRSHEVELRVVDRSALERLLHEGQTHVQQELQRLARLQQDAWKNTVSAETTFRAQGRLGPQQVDEVVQAEQLQQQLRARIGTRQEGLQAEIARILQTMRDNRFPRSGSQDRLETVAAGLERLTRERLDQIESRLGEARKNAETSHEGAPPAGEKNALAEARRHQEEVSRALKGLLNLLEPWSATSEVKGEARAILDEQRKLARDVERLGKHIPPGTSRADLKREQERLENEAILGGKLTPEQRKEMDQIRARQAALDRGAELQERLTERVEELLGRMERAGQDPKRLDAESARELNEAAQLGRKTNVPGEMRAAQQAIREAALGKAREGLQRATQGLEEMVKTLEDHREAELNRLSKRLEAAEQRLDKLRAAQDELRKRASKAAALPDPKERTRELQQLAREQEKLRQEAEETLRELTRLRRPESERNLVQAGEQMEQAARRMEEGSDPARPQEDALERLDEARRDLEEARAAVEEELAREKLAKLADQLAGLKERQESRLEESTRIHGQVLQRKQWSRGLLSSQLDLARTQEQLARETTNLADGKLAGSEVFVHLLRRAAASMDRAAEQIRKRVENARGQDSDGSPPFNPVTEQAAQERIEQSQRAALRCFDHLLEALKPDTGRPSGAGPHPMGQPPMPEQPGQGDRAGTQRRSPDTGVSPVAQLKALKGLQQDLNERIRVFAQQHPDTGKLTPDERAEVDSFRTDQQKIAELFEKITAAVRKEGEMP